MASVPPSGLSRSLAGLPTARLADGATFTRVTDAMLRECSHARLGGNCQRVLIALLRYIHVAPDGTLLVSRPSREIADVLGMTPSNVTREESALCNPERCGGRALLRSVEPGRAGVTAVYALNFDWAAPDSLSTSELKSYKASTSNPKSNVLQTAPVSTSNQKREDIENDVPQESKLSINPQECVGIATQAFRRWSE